MGQLLEIAPGFRFLSHYSSFLSSRKRPITLTLLDSNGQYNDNARRLVWWILRSLKEIYVDVGEEQQIQIEFPYVVTAVQQQLFERTNLKANTAPNPAKIIEEQVNRWLCYSCLDGPNMPSEPRDCREFATAYVRLNKLSTKLVIPRTNGDAHAKRRILELEKEARRLVDENTTLEQQNAQLREQLTSALAPKPPTATSPPVPVALPPASFAPAAPPAAPIAPPVDSADASKALRRFLETIDSKYPLDTLRDISLGSDSGLTLTNFLSHVFYALRKHGATNYPTDDELDLRYEDSGLFICRDFQIEPGAMVRVRVEKKGWAIKVGQSLLPIRRALVSKI